LNEIRAPAILSSKQKLDYWTALYWAAAIVSVKFPPGKHVDFQLVVRLGLCRFACIRRHQTVQLSIHFLFLGKRSRVKVPDSDFHLCCE
jgi:hypothetical protein